MGVAGITYFIAGDGKSLRTRSGCTAANPNGSMLRSSSPSSSARLVKVVVSDGPAVISSTQINTGRCISSSKIIVYVVICDGVATITDNGIGGTSITENYF